MAAFYNRCIASSSRLAATQPSNIAVAAFSTSASSLAAAKGKKPGKTPSAIVQSFDEELLRKY